MRGPATAPQKEISGPQPPHPASQDLIQARTSPRAAEARGPRGAGQPTQGFTGYQLGCSAEPREPRYKNEPPIFPGCRFAGTSKLG